MKYSKFELLAMGVGIAAVLGTAIASISGDKIASEVVGQILILLALFGGLHYGRKGALAGFILSTGIYAIVDFSTMHGEAGIALQLFIFRAVVYAIVAFVAGELNVRLKYLFIKLEHHDYVDDLTSLYNPKYLSKLIEKYMSEFDRYGSRFSLTSFKVKGELLSPLKKKSYNKFVKDLGNSVIRGNIRGADEAARTDELTFVVLFPNTGFEGATAATKRVGNKISNYLDRQGLETAHEDTLLTEVFEYPRDRETIEDFVVNISSSKSPETS